MKQSPLAVLALLFAVAGPPLLGGCVPLIVGAAVGGATLVATDRRSVGAQADDEAIELKVANVINTRYGDRVHVSTTSYNGKVLLSGEANDAATVATIGDIARTTDRVRSVHNELSPQPPAALSSRTNDTYITSKVKARFVEANRFSATHVKVVTDRGIVYLMGLVNKDEGDTAAQLASTTTGVVRVVKLFEYI
jgi:osmotically-inducible protein OsmY